MNFLLKIVEGPNRGAEIALPAGVAVTLGKSDGCDIVLADPTLPDEPVSIAASADGVNVGGEPLAPLCVKTFGATSFAVGPADAPWGELSWPEREVERQNPESRKSEGGQDGSREKDGAPAGSSLPPQEKHTAASGERKRRKGCFGCLAVLILLLLALAALAWLFRADPRVGEAGNRVVELYGKVAAGFSGSAGGSAAGGVAAAAPATDLAAVAAKYGVTFEKAGDAARMSGNFKTRAERLAATAEAYAAQPGVELDFSDDESFRMAADDALFTLTEGALTVSVATNRAVSLSGVSPSPFALKKTLEALNSDLPKLRAVDVSGVALGGVAGREATGGGHDDARDDGAHTSPALRRLTKKAASAADLPVCGIFTTPYPCLVLKNGARLLEGASLGGSVVVKIGADSVTLTNSTGRFTWKP